MLEDRWGEGEEQNTGSVAGDVTATMAAFAAKGGPLWNHLSRDGSHEGAGRQQISARELHFFGELHFYGMIILFGQRNNPVQKNTYKSTFI